MCQSYIRLVHQTIIKKSQVDPILNQSFILQLKKRKIRELDSHVFKLNIQD